jgi:hypothetical protein
MKTDPRAEGLKRQPRKTKAAKRQRRAAFIGTRPLTFRMALRGLMVDVKVVPVVGTTTHVNYELTISCRGKVLDWVPTRAELEHIGRTVGKQTQQQTSH